MITFKLDPADILFWLFIASALVNVVLILALYRLANNFVLISDLVTELQPTILGIWKKRFAKQVMPPWNPDLHFDKEDTSK